MRHRPLRFIVAALAALALAAARAAPPLPALGADLGGVTVSGISSGGYMAVQFEVAYSSMVSGVGVLAAGPYDCAEGSTWRALTTCMAPGALWSPPRAAEAVAQAESYATAGRIDPLRGVGSARVWVLSGDGDQTVERPVVDALVAFYRHFVGQTALRYVRLPEAGHAMISVADPQPNACATSEPPFINRCGKFDAAGELLAHLLGRVAPRAEQPRGELLPFDQRAFTAGAAADISMADRGYVYVPPGCRAGGCRVHLALHGCRQSEEQIGLRFVEGAGYNAWADTNRLIVLYPQTTPRYGFAPGSWSWVYNPKGYWDWWGYTRASYATRDGAQPRALRAMLARLAELPRGEVR